MIAYICLQTDQFGYWTELNQEYMHYFDVADMELAPQTYSTDQRIGSVVTFSRKEKIIEFLTRVL